MRETWLHPNRRALWFGCIPPLAIASFALWLALWAGSAGQSVVSWIGWFLVLVCVVVVLALARQLTRPRIAYRDGHVLFNLQSGPPFAVPVQFVEAFFVGQGPANLPGDFRGQEKTLNLVARLSQRQTDWAHRAVRPAFGSWADGYVTVRGTWCEPLNADVVRQINKRLHEIKKQFDQPHTNHAT